MTRDPVRRSCARPHPCSSDTRLRVMADSPLTRELSPTDRESLDEHLTSWAEGDPLVMADEEMRRSYLVVAGRVRITHDTTEGREITVDIAVDLAVDIAVPGDTVGPLHTHASVAA